MSPEENLRLVISRSSHIVFLGGAGVSTESGIPDFRSEDGIYWTRNKYGCPPEQLLSHSSFMQHPDIFYDFYKSSMIYKNALPNAAHRALAGLEKQGKLKAVITQNIDGLHQKAGSRQVIELHGSVHRNRCMRCGAPYSLDFVLASDGVPKCSCGGIVKPDVVLYEEPLDERALERAAGLIAGAEVLIVGGTSLSVYPAAGLIRYYRGDKMVLINKSSTPFDDRADILICGSIGKVLSDAV